MPSRPSLLTDKAQRQSLADDLRALSSLPLTTEEDLDQWDIEADKVREKLHSTYKDIAAELPGELEHYFDDADIRVRDDGYRMRQEVFLTKLLQSLDEK